ncbi:spermatogenesis-associated protein 20 isoform X2 [Lethenteron reissneri]|uniref:spermatogenesis-associated protein 20 isoform X2 n=1 Tax=Lethenteron reissneri TaxID=7753 RepID=UPI002AB6B70E|nr:spermatogenesis-associated protein 20 isoform X2 [Lethenteron reissneri]
MLSWLRRLASAAAGSTLRTGARIVALPGRVAPSPAEAATLAGASRPAPGGSKEARTQRNQRPSLLRGMATGGAHTSAGSPPRHSNRLALEKSPYLQQHAHNPVDWYPWGEEAFEKARTEDKPIFLSVGYSTCHWCHVMERESFCSEAVASVLNRHFVSVKVDREERPDVDQVYMAFIQACCGGGGWPMSVWLTPDLRPLVGGTYFPPEDSFSRPGFKTVLTQIAKKWQVDRGALRESGERVLAELRRVATIPARRGRPLPSAEDVAGLCLSQLFSSFDDVHGGFSDAPKFPTPVNLSFLLGLWAQDRNSRDGAKALEMCLHTLRMMAHGGIHDHIGQGFHRYSTDANWLVPHFEKMLYDQAQLAAAYAAAFQITNDGFYAGVARDILMYVSRDLSSQSGGFYSAEDADSLAPGVSGEKREGAFYVWTAAELRAILCDPVPGYADGTMLADVFMHHYGTQDAGNVLRAQDPHGELSGQNVLSVRYSAALTAARFGVTEAALAEALALCRQKLLEARAARPRPHRDTKMIAAWNGLMISGFARAGGALGDAGLVRRAERAAEFVTVHLFDPVTGNLTHSAYQGPDNNIEQIAAPVPGLLADYACVIRALLDVHEAGLEQRWLELAERLQGRQDLLFWDDEGHGYFTTPSTHPGPLLRMKEDQDGAEPSGNSVSAGNLLRLAALAGRPDLSDRAARLLTAFGPRLERAPIALPEMTAVLLAHHRALTQVVIRGDRGAQDTQALLDCVNSTFLPHKVLIMADGRPESFSYRRLPFLAELEKLSGEATAYVCHGSSCSAPVVGAEALRALLQASPAAGSSQ